MSYTYKSLNKFNAGILKININPFALKVRETITQNQDILGIL